MRHEHRTVTMAGPNPEVNRFVDDFGGVSATAEWCGCTERNVREWVRIGRMPAVWALYVTRRYEGYDPWKLSPEKVK